ncbi:hypothetical protein Zm00014a_006201 [Zea mays]|uniref:Uncharacterized protein n=1 Tax=Zea mays TaxID=4577 RepID=A0A3L6DDX5_MAIZE|nr:hypothetical protein Zm00014a_006201 [Zea mays]
MSGYPKYEIRTVIREDIRISEIRRISVISYPYPISELYYPNSNPKSENSANIRKKLSNRIISPSSTSSFSLQFSRAPRCQAPVPRQGRAAPRHQHRRKLPHPRAWLAWIWWWPR